MAGLRYLPQGELRLVRTALAERERLRRLTAPHLVKPLRFLFPLYHGRGPGRIALGAGLWLYDLFARTPRAERHRRVNSAGALAAEPMLNPVALVGGAFYYDAGGDDARLTIENMLDAACHGGAIANYVEVDRFVHAQRPNQHGRDARSPGRCAFRVARALVRQRRRTMDRRRPQA